MVNTETVRTIVGIIGNVISFFLFLSPMPTFIKIWKAKTVMQFKPDPYVVTALNCAVWVFYGMPFVHPDSLLVVTINGIGLFIELVYVIAFFIYSEWPKRKKIVVFLVIEIILLGILVFVTLTFLHGTKNRSMLVGILAVVMNIAMYASPLTVMRRVISTKSVKFMPFYLSLANFCNGGIWFAYAFLKFDVYILIPNGLGMLSGAIQLFLYARYYKTTNWDDDGKPSEIELPRNQGTA
ncbi:bidirectional sugar transporter SWEET5-like [Solanum dulcamara]|uniref:bidirectional sugar transporter SWEET5-like n=1 Tax=Solanum dulcamara TaxID=45834 RepID=UPI002485243D|nr:bidirectional sugar transporter SWEET5-like [Solanum dulcamara]